MNILNKTARAKIVREKKTTGWKFFTETSFGQKNLAKIKKLPVKKNLAKFYPMN